MKNSKFEINTKEKSNVIELKPKLGRNDLCYCGSGKKYKNCCMKKDQEEARLKELLANPVNLSDKYFTVKEYIGLSGYPVKRFDFFLLEILNITGSTLSIYNKTSNDINKGIIKGLYSFSKDFYKACSECKYGCLRKPIKNISFKSLIDQEYNIDELPQELQKETAMNFFYIEFINAFASNLQQELYKEIDDETADDISFSLYRTLMDFVGFNCYGECNNKCILEYDENAYCRFCTFGSGNLPCPKEGKISYEIIKATEADMEH